MVGDVLYEHWHLALGACCVACLSGLGIYPRRPSPCLLHSLLAVAYWACSTLPFLSVAPQLLPCCTKTIPLLYNNDTPTVCAGVLGRAHTVAAMDQTKIQEASGSGLHSVSGGGAAVAADLADSSAWRKQRPGATFFEKLQVCLAHPAAVLAFLVCFEGSLINCILQYWHLHITLIYRKPAIELSPFFTLEDVPVAWHCVLANVFSIAYLFVHTNCCILLAPSQSSDTCCIRCPIAMSVIPASQTYRLGASWCWHAQV